MKLCRKWSTLELVSSSGAYVEMTSHLVLPCGVDGLLLSIVVMEEMDRVNVVALLISVMLIYQFNAMACNGITLCVCVCVCVSVCLSVCLSVCAHLQSLP